MTDHSHWPDIVQSLEDHWPMIAWGIGATGGLAWWGFTQLFATRTYLKQLIAEHERREFELEETAHGMIRHQIHDVHKRVDAVDGKLSDLKNILITMRDK